MVNESSPCLVAKKVRKYEKSRETREEKPGVQKWSLNSMILLKSKRILFSNQQTTYLYYIIYQVAQ